MKPHSKKKHGSLLLTFVLVLALILALGVTVSAAPAPGGVLSALTTDNLDSVFGGPENYQHTEGTTTVKLLNDIAIADSITIAVSCTLDTNNKSINRGLEAAPTDGKGGSVLVIGDGINAVEVTILYKYSTQIKGGYAVDGGGVYIKNNAQLYARGIQIQNNTATGNGGGVYIDNGGVFYGECDIKKNSAAYGGGVYIADGGTFKTFTPNGNGADITGNTASINGGGVYVDGTLNVKGYTAVQTNKKGEENNNVYLPTGKTIAFDATNTDTPNNIYVTTQTAPTDTEPVSIVSGFANDYSAKFKSDITGRNVYSEAVSGNWVLKLTSASNLPSFTLQLVPQATNMADAAKTKIYAGKNITYDLMLSQTNPYAPSTLECASIFCGISYDDGLTFVSSSAASNVAASHELKMDRSATYIKKLDNAPTSIGTVTFTVPDAAAVAASGTDQVYRLDAMAITPLWGTAYGVSVSQFQTTSPLAAVAYAVDVIMPPALTIQWQKLIAVYDGTAQAPDVSAFTGRVGTDDVAVTVAETEKKIAAGTYTVTATLTGNDKASYTLSNPTASFTVQRAPVTFTVSDDSAQFNEQPHTATVSAVANGRTFDPANYTVSYKQGDTAVASPTAVGVYDVCAAITDQNYRHTDTTNGDVRKIGVLTIYAAAPPPTYTVAIRANGGIGVMEPLDAVQKDVLRVLPPCTLTPPAGCVFAGWRYNNKIYQPGDTLAQPADHIAITAVWEYIYQISGTVTQGKAPDDVAAPATVVTLMLGSQQIDQDIADENGEYSFHEVAPGLYNLVGARNGITQTISVEITDGSQAGKNIVLPAQKTNSLVEVKEGTPAIVVGNLEKSYDEGSSLYTEEDQTVVTNGGSVDIKLNAAVTEADATVTKIEEQAEDTETIGLFLDVNIIKTVTDQAGSQEKTEIITTDSLLTLTIMLPAAMQGKLNYVVYRIHEGAVDKLTTVENSDHEYIEVNREKTIITVHAKKFSGYGVGFGAFTVDFNANGGQCNITTLTTDGEGKLTSLPTPTRAGNYRFGGWYQSNNARVTLNTVFAANATVTAKWIYTGGGYDPPVTACTLSFDVNGGSEIAAITGPKGAVVELAAYTPDRAGYTFAGWYADAFLTTKVAAVTLTGDTIVYAKWTKIEEKPGFPFTDVTEKDWFYHHVVFVYDNGLMGGTDATTFSPQLSTTRGMIVTILYRLEGEPAVAGACPFGDVRTGSYCENAVIWGASHEIVKGYGPTQFGPEDAITREQLAAILYRYAGYKGCNITAAADLAKFADHDKISRYARPALSWAHAEGLINGKGNSILDPRGNALRCEVAAILDRFCQTYKK